MTLAQGIIIAGKYVLESKIGSGGMGSVWAARHLHLDARVAIKFIDPSLASDGAGVRFEREAKACAQVQSPHMIRVHDYGSEDDMPYIVMELVTGESLGDRLKRYGRLGLVEAAVIVSQVCKGLRHAHEAGIIHRDLKPNNIFLAQVHEDEVVKILDFGVAKAASFSAAVTTVGCLVGTPRYMSPEQARRSRDLDHRSDLWSLGVVLFRCLTGRMPFQGGSIGEVLAAICSGPIPVPSQVAPDLGPDVDRFFERALARDPAARFQSAREMAEAFAAIAGTAAAGETSGVSIVAPAVQVAPLAAAATPLPAAATPLPAARPSVGSMGWGGGGRSLAQTIAIPAPAPSVPQLASVPAAAPSAPRLAATQLASVPAAAPSAPRLAATQLASVPTPAPSAPQLAATLRPVTMSTVLMDSSPAREARPSVPRQVGAEGLRSTVTPLEGHSVRARPARPRPRRRVDVWAVLAGVVVAGAVGVAGLWKMRGTTAASMAPAAAASGVEASAKVEPAAARPDLDGAASDAAEQGTAAAEGTPTAAPAATPGPVATAPRPARSVSPSPSPSPRARPAPARGPEAPGAPTASPQAPGDGDETGPRPRLISDDLGDLGPLPGSAGDEAGTHSKYPSPPKESSPQATAPVPGHEGASSAL